MAFPAVEYCVVCEDVRPEIAGKSTIIGFYGLLPEVELSVGDLTKPIDRLAFMLICSAGGSGTYEIVPQLLNPRGKEVGKPSDPVTLTVPEIPGKRMFVFAFSALQFDGAGDYTFVLRVDRHALYSGKFHVRQGAT